MRRVTTLLKFIGVTLCVAPILSVAYAQQGSSQGDLLLEMQEMRREIAELRDMVERQQFQLRKLQRSSTTAPSTDRQSAGLVRPAANQVGAGSMSSTSNVPNSTGVGQQSSRFPNSNEGGSELNPMPSDLTSSETSAGAEYPASDQVEERIITAPALSNGTVNSSSQGYPPVIDRSIGASPGQPAGNNSADSNNVNRGGAVAGIPNGSDVAQAQPNQNVYQQTQPNPIYQQRTEQANQASQPAAQVARPGGVVSIPPVSTLPASRESEYGRDYGSKDVATADSSSVDGIPTALSESDYYRQGFDLMKQSKFDDAVSVFEKQLAAYPRGESADDAHYWIAEAMYVSRNLDVAKKHLRTLIQEYPRSRRVPDAMLKTAYIEQQQGNQIEARILFQEIVNFFPKSDAAIAAKNRLADSD
ncbi:tol-pal system protein YbgF [Arenicella xantha]|uniref:Cell division coordinator CpoB n=1 Tax=Arenicella xantha TaxID=644221 RepID=A0A395JNY8_9GAMM|nr:tol-pal system protein YbgF [Arenicella xantha]RBP53217.1 tol-pal system protein YbgF [Arenicella xantha]